MPRIRDRTARLQWALEQFSQEELSLIAEKFGSLTCANREDVIVGRGYLTQEEFDALIACPREGEVTSAGSWPRIGGRKIYPLSSALTQEEVEAYYNFKNGGGYSPSPRRAYTPAPAPQVDMTSFWMFFDLARTSGNEGAIGELLKMFPAVRKYEGLLTLAVTRGDEELIEELKKVI